jgi:hypothetical protein
VKPVLLVDNLFNRALYRSHTLDASSQAAGREAWRVGTGRRGATNSWKTDGSEEVSFIEVGCDEERSADLIVLDRGHNLTGKRIVLTADAVEVLDLSIPSAALSESSIDDGVGVVTGEGAWLRRFEPAAGVDWRLTIHGDQTCEIRGLYLGSAWQLPHFLDLPYYPHSHDVRFDTFVTDAGWMGRGPVARPRTGVLNIKLHTDASLALAEDTVDRFTSGRPMWIVHAPAAARRDTVLADSPTGEAGFHRQGGWYYGQAAVRWIEREPELP